jgi:predicted transcriptional regulator
MADAVGEEPVSIAELAAELGVDLGSLTRLLRHLATLGLSRSKVTASPTPRLLGCCAPTIR